MFLQVSLVAQEPILFARTVEENISYGLTDSSMEAVVEAATQANAHDFISALPRGYNTGTRALLYCVVLYQGFRALVPLWCWFRTGNGRRKVHTGLSAHLKDANVGWRERGRKRWREKEREGQR